MLLGAVEARAAAAPGGALNQPSGRGGCVYDPGGGSAQGLHVDLPRRCGTASPLDGAYDVAMSPDGRSLYVASFNADSLTAFARDATTGSLRQLGGGSGCIVEDPWGAACVEGIGLDNPAAVVVSPDGRSVYVASYYSHAIASFARNRATGALTQLARPDACISASELEFGCTGGEALGGATALAVSPDGRHVYVAAALSNAVSVFARNASTGALRELGCIRDAGATGPGDPCAAAVGLDAATSIAVSRDGRNVYVASLGSSAVAVFARDRATGALSQLPGRAGCVADVAVDGTCADARSLAGAFAVAVSADGKSVYVAKGFDLREESGDAFAGSGVSVFRRSAATGALTQLGGARGCVSHNPLKEGCARGRALEGAQSVTVSPDGRNVYVAATASNAVSIFARNAQTGAVQQLAGKAGCISETGSRGACRDGAGLWGVSAVVVAPNGRHAYAPGFYSSAVAVLARTPPPKRSGR